MSLLDLASARHYLTHLTGEEDPVVTWQTFDDDKDHKLDPDPLAGIRHGRLSAHERHLVELNTTGRMLSDGRTHRAGVFISINQMDGDGREVANCVGLRALFIDQDGGTTLPTTWRVRPSLIVQRDDTHWHAYWLLQPGEDKARFAAGQTHLACHFLSDLKIKDLPRVLRVPGFQHNKRDPLPVRLIHVEHPRTLYSIDELMTAHPVDFDKLDDKYHRGAVLVGLAKERRPVTAARPAQRPASSGEQRVQDEAFLKWARQKDTRGGAANDNGTGNDTAAFTIACEGAGRVQDGIVSGEHIVRQAVEEFITRCGWNNIDSETDRLVRGAFSQKRKHNAVQMTARPSRVETHQRMSAPPQAGEDRFGGDEPPAPPAAKKTEPEEEPPRFGGIDLERLGARWALSERGVAPVEIDGEGKRVAKPNRRVCGLPIWPERAGTDVASGATWWKLGWHTPYGTTEYAWLSEYDVKQGHALVALANGPVAKRHAENCAVYLTEARAAVTQARAEVTSRIGWCGVNGSRRWVFPGVGAHSKVEYIGGALPSHGKLDEWKKGLEHLVKLPEDDGFTALTVVCLSAASPWSRLMGSRNPIIGLMGPSSSGKGSALDYALSIWSDIDLMRLPASSTSKGIEDKAVAMPDLPIFMDELQQLGELHPQATGNVLYFLANGQRRTTSSKNQQAVGGERRYGVGFYAAEAPVLPGQNLGVLYRVIELDGRPCPDEATAKALQSGTQHTGTLAGPIAALIGEKTASEWVDHVRGRAAAMRKAHPSVVGDDPEALALIERGCEVLQQVTGLEIPKDELLRWLAAKIIKQRASVIDRETRCLHQVMGVAVNQNWRGEDDPSAGPDHTPRARTVVSLQGRPVAWRTYESSGSTKWLDVDPSHPQLAPLFVAHGGEDRVLRHWADKGWIVRQDGRLRVARAGAGRVVRFTNDAWRELSKTIVTEEVTA